MASIYRRKNGVWYVKFRENGRWIYRSLQTRNKRQAESERAAIERKLAADARLAKTGPQPDLTFEELKKRYVAWATPQRRPLTIDSRVRALDRFSSLTGVASIGEVEPDHIEAFKQKVIASGLTPRTANEAISALRAVIYRAMRQKWYTGQNPFASVDMLPEPKRHPKWLTKEQIAQVLELAEIHSPNAHLFFAMCIYAGLRKDEAINARWEWIDFDAGLLHVQDGHNWKTKTGSRTLPLHSRLRAIVLEYGPPAGGRGYLISPDKAHGKYRYRFEIRKTFAAVAQAAKIEGLTPHVLRHTFASQLAMAGVSLWKISQYLGHTSVRTTQIYAHLRPEGDEDIDRF